APGRHSKTPKVCGAGGKTCPCAPPTSGMPGIRVVPGCTGTTGNAGVQEAQRIHESGAWFELVPEFAEISAARMACGLYTLNDSWTIPMAGVAKGNKIMYLTSLELFFRAVTSPA